MVNRLQQPTHSYLARSRSAMSLSGEQTGNTHTHTPYKRGLTASWGQQGAMQHRVASAHAAHGAVMRSVCLGLLNRRVSGLNQIWPDLKHYSVWNFSHQPPLCQALCVYTHTHAHTIQSDSGSISLSIMCTLVNFHSAFMNCSLTVPTFIQSPTTVFFSWTKVGAGWLINFKLKLFVKTIVRKR